MTDAEYIPLIAGVVGAAAGLVGALIGSLTSIGTIYIQQRAQNKRERHNQVINAATKQFELAIKVAEIRGSGAIPPFAEFLLHHYELYELLEKGELNEKTLKQILDNEN